MIFSPLTEPFSKASVIKVSPASSKAFAIFVVFVAPNCFARLAIYGCHVTVGCYDIDSLRCYNWNNITRAKLVAR